MAYEIEAMESVQTAGNVKPIEMREERVINAFGQSDLRIQKAREKVAAAAAAGVTKPLSATNQQNIDKTNVATEETKIAAEESATLSPGAAALARRELKFREAQEQLKKDRAELDAAKAKVAKYEAMEKKLVAKDYSGVEEAGIDYNEYAKYLLEKQTGTTPEQETIKKLQEEVEGVKKAQKEDIEKRFDAAVQDRRKAVIALAEKPEFAAIKKAKAEEAVVQHILDTWENDNIDLDPETAAKEVKEVLLEKAKEFAALLEEPQAQLAEGEKKPIPPLKTTVKTITNNMAATGEIKRQVKSFHGMSDTERYAEARRRAEEKLKVKG